MIALKSTLLSKWEKLATLIANPHKSRTDSTSHLELPNTEKVF